MLEYIQEELCVLPFKNELDMHHMQNHLRYLYRTDPAAHCHALKIASYLNFRNECLRILRQGGEGRAHASLPDGYRLQYHDGVVMVSRLTFKVMQDESVGASDAGDPMDI